MALREWEIPAAKIPGQKMELDAEGKQKIVPIIFGLADLLLDNVLSQPDLYKTIEGIDLVMTLNPVLQPLRADAGAGAKVRQSEAQWELLKKHTASVFQRVAPESQVPVAEAIRSLLTAKVVSDEKP